MAGGAPNGEHGNAPAAAEGPGAFRSIQSVSCTCGRSRRSAWRSAGRAGADGTRGGRTCARCTADTAASGEAKRLQRAPALRLRSQRELSTSAPTIRVLLGAESRERGRHYDSTTVPTTSRTRLAPQSRSTRKTAADSLRKIRRRQSPSKDHGSSRISQHKPDTAPRTSHCHGPQYGHSTCPDRTRNLGASSWVRRPWEAKMQRGPTRFPG